MAKAVAAAEEIQTGENMTHKDFAEKVVLPVVCAFAAGVLVALHVVEDERAQAAQVVCQDDGQTQIAGVE